jgi:hypothetical protein
MFLSCKLKYCQHKQENPSWRLQEPMERPLYTSILSRFLWYSILFRVDQRNILSNLFSQFLPYSTLIFISTGNLDSLQKIFHRGMPPLKSLEASFLWYCSIIYFKTKEFHRLFNALHLLNICISYIVISSLVFWTAYNAKIQMLLTVEPSCTITCAIPVPPFYSHAFL